jgi:hypothetical protein
VSVATPEVRTLDYAEPSPFNVFDLFPYEETDDPKKRTHIVNPVMNRHVGLPGMSAQDIVDSARMTDQEVEALCGYRFVPKHDPEKFDACNACVTIAGALMRGNGE